MTKSTADMLRGVVDILRSGDQAFTILGEMLEQVPPKTDQAQSDLLMMAAWLDSHAEVDAEIATIVQAGDHD